MAVSTLIPVEEYLRTVYQPDCDYVDGRLVERNVGEMDHGDAQVSCASYIRSKCKGYWAVVEVRMQVKKDRFRIPDVTIVKGGKPGTRIFVEPPLAVVEVLSPEDRMSSMQQRIDDYLEFGVAYVWVIDPETRRGFVYTAQGSVEAKDGVLRAGELVVPLAAIFES